MQEKPQGGKKLCSGSNWEEVIGKQWRVTILHPLFQSYYEIPDQPDYKPCKQNENHCHKQKFSRSFPGKACIRTLITDPVTFFLGFCKEMEEEYSGHPE